MEKHSVVPDVIDVVPREVLQVTYGDLSVNLGNELTPTQVKDTPTVTWNAEVGEYYLLCMIDNVNFFLEGLHRYVFLVYKQPGKITYDEPRIDNRTRATRLKFSTRQLVKKYNLGDPLAGNFYQAQYDDYVPIFHSLLK
ncbi:OV-16 antigen [Blattella germanica]|nr:OV-16 antigen [Blattella germanica]